MTIQLIVDNFNTWLDDSVASVSNFGKRTWCLLGFPKVPITQASISTFFDRSDLNSQYVNAYSVKSIPDKQEYAYLQAEINMIYSTHKSFVVRHKSRLQSYRDNCAFKDYFVRSSVAMAQAKFLKDKTKAERTN